MVWVFHFEVYKKGKTEVYEWTVTDYEFKRLLEFAKKDFKPRTKYRDYVRKIYEKVKDQLPPHLPLVSFMAWTAACLKSYLGYTYLYPHAGVEWVPEVTNVRLQYTVMYYAREQKRHTPNPFCECRAWCIVPSASDLQRIKERLRVEAWYVGVLFYSLYWAWEDEELEKVTAGVKVDEGEPKELKMRMIREGYEQREVEEATRGIARAVAFYRDFSSEWGEPYFKYDEETIRKIEDSIRDCILQTYDTFWEYKLSMAELLRKAAKIMEINYEKALDYVRTAYGITAECMPEHPTVKYGFYLTGGEE